jgi:hypothetical protein
VKPPERPLCQHDAGSCAACCGLYNFADRSPAATQRRLDRRTDAVRAAWPDVDELAAARDELLAAEREEVLFAGVRVCPFAGWVEDGRVGCLLHPTRHPDGADLRDLAVYPKEVCRDHFCAPHDWLRPVEVALAQTCTGVSYGLVVTDAGVVKGVRQLLEDALGGPLSVARVERTRDALGALWRALLDWPHRDPDPQRFGGFHVVSDEAVERTLPSCLAGLDVDASHAQRVVLDGLGTAVRDAPHARAALAALDALIEEAARALR